MLRELTRLSVVFDPPTSGVRPSNGHGIWGDYSIDSRAENAYAYQFYVTGKIFLS